MIELLLLCGFIFALLLPVCLIRGLLRKRSLGQSLEEAWQFAVYGAIGLIVLGIGLALIVGIPFGVFNMTGLAFTGREFCWSIILPGLALLYAGVGIGIWREFKKDHAKKMPNAEASFRRSRE